MEQQGLGKYYNILFYILVAICLSIIVVPKIYLTGDGPSHTYNAQILADYIFGNNKDFYNQYYSLNKNIEPNWTSQLLLVGFLQICPNWLADKAMQILYVLLFAFGFKYLIKQINYKGNAVAFLFYPFCFTLLFQMGFYNYSLAIAIMFWLMGYTIKHFTTATNYTFLLLCFGTILLAITHGMVASLFILWFGVFSLCNVYINKTISLKNAITNTILTVAPACIIIIAFTLRQGLHTTAHKLSYTAKCINFLKLYTLQSTLYIEQYICYAFAGIVVVLIALSFKYFTIKTTAVNTSIAIIIGYTFISYITAPDTLAYAGGIDIRLAGLPILFLLILISSLNFNTKIQCSIALAGIIITTTWIGVRWQAVNKASTEAIAAIQIGANIKPKSTVLQVMYNMHGKNYVIEKDNSFLHVLDYIGATKNKSLIMLNNYEATNNYFFFKWKDNMHPYASFHQLVNNSINSPKQIAHYETNTKTTVDYIILQDDLSNGKNEPITTPTHHVLLDSLQLSYVVIDSNTTYGVRLLERK